MSAPLITCIANCDQTASVSGVVTIDSLQELIYPKVPSLTCSPKIGASTCNPKICVVHYILAVSMEMVTINKV